jgi:hypothetical protein
MVVAKSKRRWFQYRLRSLMLFTTLAAGATLAWRSWLEPHHRQRQTMALIERLGGNYQTTQAPSWLSHVLRYNVKNVVCVDLTAIAPPPAEYLADVSRLPQLEELSVAGLAFGDDELRRLHRVKSLRGLVLNSTSVTDEGVAALAESLPQVAIRHKQGRAILTLDLKFNADIRVASVSRPDPITDRDRDDSEAIEITLRPGRDKGAIPYLRALRTLLRLNLGGTSTDDDGLKYCSSLMDLITLNLPYTQVGDAGLPQLQRLAALQSLDLEGTRVGDDGLRSLKGLSSLHALCLAGTKVTDAGLRELSSLTNLRELDLRNTGVTAEGAKKLKKLLPQCAITF